MNALFDLIPFFCSGTLVCAQLYVAEVLETTAGMVPFSTPLGINFHFYLWYFVRTVLCSAKISHLFCLVVNLLVHLLFTFSLMVGGPNLNIFSCMASDCS